MTFKSLTDTYELSNGVKIPIIGFGTWQTPNGDVAYQSTLDALAAGYRHIDTAAIYGNEESIGQAIIDSGIDRKELFITSKLWNDRHSFEGAQAALEESLNKLQLDYLDLYLIHWPNPVDIRDNWQLANAETWRAMEHAYESGKVRAIGISNFQPHHFESLLETAKVTPQVNQLFVNPSDLETDAVTFNQRHNTLTEAYSPLATNRLLKVPELIAIGEKYGKSAAQVTLRWSLQHGFLPLPKSTHQERIVQNTQLFDFDLTPEDMAKIDALSGVAGLHTNPDETDF
ncbi:aldo/keto reductase [Weissella diestrammenae]|uniref:Aldo/keto reductase n=1 Tax=Weissella diestrammenae TaxID=1162633 RepID=A0A7G9T767_9LACO|nr:aldo/keto reductase [Weissella diestrammenae]MCM0582456.1 aldo/keto reductase [Weissella diestrammenae]QNN75942.1 aldo/keto reductase [Weissella diestrammenae]